MIPMRIVVFLLVISTTFVTACFFNCPSSEEQGDKCCDRNCRCGYFETCTDCNTCVKRWDVHERYSCKKDPCQSSCAQKINICGNKKCQIQMPPNPPYLPYPPPHSRHPSPGGYGPPRGQEKSKTFEEILDDWN